MHARTSHHNALPMLDANEAAHQQRVQAHIAQAIQQAGGWIDFAEYMSLALYAPGLGYYSAGAHKLGAGGDFTTAPELSPLFSRCVALQAAQVLAALRQEGAHPSVLELGAGSGVMAAELLLELERQQCLPKHYAILEVSADLRERQQQLLRQRVPHLLARIHWLDALPTQFVGVIVANEVLDALPVSRFIKHQGQALALGVSVEDGRLVDAARPASEVLQRAVSELEVNLGAAFPDGYRSEVNLQMHEWIRGLADALQRGVLLFIDYGYPQSQYYAAERSDGTLSCFFKQRMHDHPLINAGVQDITAWVDFTRVAEAGIAAGLELKGFATQAHFLIGCGLQQLLNGLTEADDTTRWRLSQQVQKLTLPGDMGESFKAMALGRDCDIALQGFSFRDLRDRL